MLFVAYKPQDPNNILTSKYKGFKHIDFKNPVLHFLFDTHYIFGSWVMIILILSFVMFLSIL